MHEPLLEDGPELAVKDERRLVAALCFLPYLVTETAADLRGTAFTDPFAATAFEALVAMSAAVQPIDSGTLAERLEAHRPPGSEGPSWGVRLWRDFIPLAGFHSEAHARLWARRIRERWIKREAARIEAEASERFAAAPIGAGAELEQAVTWLQGEAAALGAKATPPRGGPVSSRARAFARWVHSPDDAEAGVPSGIGPLDRHLRALVPGRLYTLAARPGVGKSTVALQIATNVALAGGSALFLSCEMGEDELYATILANLSSVDSENIARRRLTQAAEGHFDDAVQRLTRARFSIFETPACSLARAHSLVLKAQHEHKGLDLVVVDYLNLMQPETARNTPRYLQIGELARGLKTIARLCNTAVLQLAQLSRGSEHNGAPGLADLKESGGIEEHSDVVAMFWRDPEEWKTSRSVRFGVRKNRHGRCGEFSLRHNLEHRRMEVLPDPVTGGQRGQAHSIGDDG